MLNYIYIVQAKYYLIYVQALYEDNPENSLSEGDEGGKGDDEDATAFFPMEKLTAILGDEKPQLCKALIHLVMADSVYVENTDQGQYLVLSA